MLLLTIYNRSRSLMITIDRQICALCIIGVKIEPAACVKNEIANNGNPLYTLFELTFDKNSL